MSKLSLFDDGIRIATITKIDNSVFLFARSSREWSEIKRLINSFNSKDKNFLELVAEKAHSYNFSTELLNE